VAVRGSSKLPELTAQPDTSRSAAERSGRDFIVNLLAERLAGSAVHIAPLKVGHFLCKPSR
jgi:hypothetical protein